MARLNGSSLYIRTCHSGQDELLNLLNQDESIKRFARLPTWCLGQASPSTLGLDYTYYMYETMFASLWIANLSYPALSYGAAHVMCVRLTVELEVLSEKKIWQSSIIYDRPFSAYENLSSTKGVLWGAASSHPRIDKMWIASNTILGVWYNDIPIGINGWDDAICKLLAERNPLSQLGLLTRLLPSHVANLGPLSWLSEVDTVENLDNCMHWRRRVLGFVNEVAHY